MKLSSIILSVLFFFPSLVVLCQTGEQYSFKVIPLGVKGGIDESNLSAYMLASKGSQEFICLDAGTLHCGIQKAIESGLFKDSATRVLRSYIKGYLISHPHLDHVSGLILNSPDDSSKNIYGLPHCINILREKYFTWQNWANFSNEGEKPVLKKYHYSVLEPGKETPVEGTSLQVTAFALSHSNPYESTAFLLSHNGDYLLYLGDTGSDRIEKSDKLALLWKQIAPLVKSGKLKGIFIEVSYPDEQPESQLFGHLTPHLLMDEMNTLGQLTGQKSLQAFPVAITHMKPSGSHERDIIRQLTAQNSLQLKLLFPEQGKMLQF